MEKRSGKKNKAANSKQNYSSNIWWLGIVSLLADASSEMIAPVMPLFLSSVLGASGFLIGLIEGLGKAAERLLSFVFGWYSDKIGKRKPIVALGYFISAVMKGLFSFTNAWYEFLFVRLIERSGKSIRDAPRDALLAVLAGERLKERREGYALHRMLDTVGAIIGPILALLVISYLVSDFENTARTLFLISLIPGLIAVLVILFLVKEPPMDKNRDKKGLLKTLTFEFGDKYKLFLISVFPFFLLSPPLAFLYLQGSAAGLELSGVITLGLIYSVFYLLGAGSIGYFTRLTGIKIGKETGISLAFFLAFISFMMIAFFSSNSSLNVDIFSATNIIFIFAFLLYSIGIGILEVESKTYMSMIVDKKELGSALGVYQTTTGILIILSGLIFGLLWDYSHFVAFAVSGIASLISLIVFISTNKELKKVNKAT